jgi:hypothetical protein
MAYIYFEVQKDNEEVVRELRQEGNNITEVMNDLLKAYAILRTKKEPII